MLPPAESRSQIVAEAGLCLALAAVLKMLRLFALPLGGSVTAGSLAPLWLFARRRGPLRGAWAGAAFGVIDLLQHPVIVHWAQALLDYPLAFATVGLAGLRGLPAKRAGSGAVGPSSRIGQASGEPDGRGAETPPAAGLPLPLCLALATLARYGVHVVSGALFFSTYTPAGWDVWPYSAAYNLYVVVDAVVAAGVVVAVRARVGGE